MVQYFSPLILLQVARIKLKQLYWSILHNYTHMPLPMAQYLTQPTSSWRPNNITQSKTWIVSYYYSTLIYLKIFIVFFIFMFLNEIWIVRGHLIIFFLISTLFSTTYFDFYPWPSINLNFYFSARDGTDPVLRYNIYSLVKQFLQRVNKEKENFVLNL